MKKFFYIGGSLFIVLAISSYLLYVVPAKNSNTRSQVPIKSATQTPKKKITPSSTFLFAGDLMLDRFVYHSFKDKGLEHIFDNFSNDVFEGKNVSILNLEGPISQEPIIDDNTVDNLIFNFPPETGNVLKDLHINAVSLANNHTSNAGKDGNTQTKNILDAASISYCGGESYDETSGTIDFKSNPPISVICVNLLTNPKLSLVDDKIKSEKARGNFVIIFPHWGNEYQTRHSPSQQEVAYRFINAGADAIFGSHPHVVQDFELYQGKPIVYSMGNFVFDQLFSKETQQGLLIGGKVTKNSLELSFLPVKQISIQPQLMSGEEKQVVIDKLLNDQSKYEVISSDTIKLKR